jgi:hypothetical protein
LTKTSAGWLGILQITGFAENPPSVKFRSILMQKSGSQTPQ